MRFTLKDWLAVGALVLGATASAEPTPKRALLIVSKTSHTLAVVDPASLKVLGRVPVGEDPHEVVASLDGKTAYVSNTEFGRAHELNVIDVVAQKALPNVDTGTVSILENVLLQPTVPPTGVLPPNAKAQLNWLQTLVPVAENSEGFDMSPDDKELWAASPTGAFTVVDLTAKAEGNRVFVSCTPDNDVAVIDLKTLEVTGHIDVGGRPDGLAWAVRH